MDATTTSPDADGGASPGTEYQQLLQRHLTEEHSPVPVSPEANLEDLHREIHNRGQAGEGHVVEHTHDRDDLDPAYFHCPACGSIRLETADLVPGQAACSIRLDATEPDGVDFEWTGDTRMCWDGQHTEVDHAGRKELWCRECGHTFSDDRVRGQRPSNRVVIVVDGGIATIAAKPLGVEVIVVDRDPDAEDPVVITVEPPGACVKAYGDLLALIDEEDPTEVNGCKECGGSAWPGIRYPATPDHITGLAKHVNVGAAVVERCTACGRYESDEAAAFVIASQTGQVAFSAGCGVADHRHWLLKPAGAPEAREVRR